MRNVTYKNIPAEVFERIEVEKPAVVDLPENMELISTIIIQIILLA